MQTTNQLLMIRPVNFSFNAETAVNNAFQQAGQAEDAQAKASTEFDQFVAVLRANGVSVMVIDDTPQPYTPDSIFPNNWISFHDDGRIVLYPMFALNRRKERKLHVIDMLLKQFVVREQIDFSSFEKNDMFMEGTGSMVLDRDSKIAYACLSPRTHPQALAHIANALGYRVVAFDAVDQKNQPIYHTNVVMCVADRYVVICLDSIADQAQRLQVEKAIIGSGKTLIAISLAQMNQFAGNMLQVHNNKNEKLLVMSSQAFHALTPAQVQQLNQFNRIIHSPLTTIETNGGGSARCMMAEIFLQPRL